MAAPDRLYLEQWPAPANRDDRIFYEPTGYGDDGNGNTSTITVYVKERLAEQPTQQTARVAFKAWGLEAQSQFLNELRVEHAYCAGAAGQLFPFPEWSSEELRAAWQQGGAHYAERQRQVETGERGVLPLADSAGTVTWDFVDTDLGLDDEQLATRRMIRERICAARVVDVVALEGEFSGEDGEPYWYALYLRDPSDNGDQALALSVGTITCASGRPTHQAIVAALSRWTPGPEYRVAKDVHA